MGAVLAEEMRLSGSFTRPAPHFGRNLRPLGAGQ
jgi:hypothetical protein